MNSIVRRFTMHRLELTQKRKSIATVTVWLVAFAISFTSVALAQTDQQEDKVSIRSVGSHSDYFGGEPVKWQLELSSDVNQEVVVEWTIELNSRTLIRRSSTQKVTANKPHLFQIEFEAPNAKEGAILPCFFSVGVLGPKDELLASDTKQIWFFSKDPFYESENWLKQLEITLVDSSGRTTELLESLAIPFRKAEPSPGIIGKGMLIIGEGVRWDAVVEQSVRQAIIAGRPVLCFAPQNGEFRLGTSRPAQMPEVCLRNLSFISQLDKRLSPSRCESNYRCNVQNDRGELLVKVGEKLDGWQFLEMRDTESHGHLILCCIAFDQNDTPTPSYLLAKLFERLCPNTVSNTELTK